MVKHLSTLACYVLSRQQSLVAAVTRVQHGFLPDRNVKHAQEVMEELKRILHEMEELVKTNERQKKNEYS
jgi:hypothetical protein